MTRILIVLLALIVIACGGDGPRREPYDQAAYDNVRGLLSSLARVPEDAVVVESTCTTIDDAETEPTAEELTGLLEFIISASDQADFTLRDRDVPTVQNAYAYGLVDGCKAL